MGKAGRPRKDFSEAQWKQVENMCSIHCTLDEICGIMDITDKTLTRMLKERYDLDFSAFFKKYSAGGKMSIRRAQFRSGVEKGNTAMLIWLGKQYLGQRDHFVEEEHHNNIIKLAYANKKELKNGTEE